MRWVLFAGALLLAAVIAYLGWSSWQVAGLVDRILSFGTPIAQGETGPPAERPEDIGYAGDPRTAFGLPFEEIAVETEVGPAPAWLVVPRENASQAWAIVVHGIGGRRENGYRFLKVLQAAGLPTLIISYRNDDGAPLSPNGLYSLGLTEWRDLEAASQLALDRGAVKLVLVAESMGGAIVGQFLRNSPLAGRVSGIVLDAPMLDLPQTLASLIGRLGVPLPRIVAAGALWLTNWRYPIRLSEAVVTGDIAAYPGQLFLSHGEDDRIVPVSTSDELAGLRSAPTQYLRTGADHILSWKEDPGRYDAALRAFLGTLPQQ